MTKLVVVAVLVAAISSARQAAAFCRTTTDLAFVPSTTKPCDDVGAPLAWKSKCVGYYVQVDGSPLRGISAASARAAARAAFGAWSATTCPLDVAACGSSRGANHPTIGAADLGTATCTKAEYSTSSGNANVVLFRDDAWPYPDGDSTLALTTVSFDPDTGELYDADIELNTAEHRISTDGSTPLDLEGILTHEAGHFFGLAHTQPANSDAVMSVGALRLTLALDDACGICSAYGPTRTAVCDTAPRHGVAACAVQPTGSSGCHCAVACAATSRESTAGSIGALVALATAIARRRDHAAPRRHTRLHA